MPAKAAMWALFRFELRAITERVMSVVVLNFKQTVGKRESMTMKRIYIVMSQTTSETD